MIVANATGCMEIICSPYPFMAGGAVDSRRIREPPRPCLGIEAGIKALRRT